MKIMVIGGWNSTGDSLSDVELLDPHNRQAKCRKVENLPSPLWLSTAQVLNNVPIVCGGNDKNSTHKTCFYLKENRWIKNTHKLRHKRAFSASIILPPDNTKMWITGGSPFPIANTSEILSNVDSPFEQGISLPEKMSDHCMAKVNDSHVVMAGNYWNRRMAYLVNVKSKPFKFHLLPPMLKERYAAGCGIINNMNTSSGANGGLVLFVAGGRGFNKEDGGGWGATTEYFNFEDQKWHLGPKLPRGFAFGGYINKENTIFLLGGFDKKWTNYGDIMVYNKTTNAFDMMPVKLNTGRYSFSTIAIEDNEKCVRGVKN